MDMLDIDPEVLFSTADAISAYCAKQRETINVYYAQIRALEDSWQDDKTFGSIVDEITALRAKVVTVIDEINEKYPRYFRLKAQEILDRPTFDNRDGGVVRIIEEVRVPPQSTPYYGDYSRATYGSGYHGDSSSLSNSNTASAKTTHNAKSGPYETTDKGYIKSTFHVGGSTPRLNSALTASFANAPQSLMEGVYRTTDRLEFVASDNGCYYDPCGGAHASSKSVIGVDFNSSTLSDNLISLVGQHVFYYAEDADYYDLLDALKQEGNRPDLLTNSQYQEYLTTFKEGVYIPAGQTDDRLSKKAYKTAARFFVECFAANVNNDEKAKSELKTLFPKSYDIVMGIIEKKTDVLTLGGD